METRLLYIGQVTNMTANGLFNGMLPYSYVSEDDPNKNTYSCVMPPLKRLPELSIGAIVDSYITRLKTVCWENVEHNVLFWKNFPTIPRPMVNEVYHMLYLKSADINLALRHSIIIPFLDVKYKNCLKVLNVSKLKITTNLFAKILSHNAASLKRLIAIDMPNLDMHALCLHLQRFRIVFTALEVFEVNQHFFFFEKPAMNSVTSLEESKELEDLIRLFFVQLELPTDTVHPVLEERVSITFLGLMPKLSVLSCILGNSQPNMTPEEIACVVTQLTKKKLSTLVVNAWFVYKKTPFPFLTSLSVHNSPIIPRLQKIINDHPNLVHLDISNLAGSRIYFNNPSNVLFQMVNSFKNLEYLDISGTNLFQVEGEIDSEIFDANKRFDSDIPGLCGLHKKLKWLVLFHCGHAGLLSLPAHNILSECTQDQLIASIKFFMEDPYKLAYVLSDVAWYYNRSSITNRATETMLLLIEAIERFPHDIKLCRCFLGATLSVMDYCTLNDRSRHVITCLVFDITKRFFDDIPIIRTFSLLLSRFNYENYDNDLMAILKFACNVYSTSDLSEATTRQCLLYFIDSVIPHFEEEELINLNIINMLKTGVLYFPQDWSIQVLWHILCQLTDGSLRNVMIFLGLKYHEFYQGIPLLKHTLGYIQDFEGTAVTMLRLLGNICELTAPKFNLFHAYPTSFTFPINTIMNQNSSFQLVYYSAAIFRPFWIRGFRYWCKKGEGHVWQLIYNGLFNQIDRFGITEQSLVKCKDLSPYLEVLRSHKSQVAQTWAVWCLANLIGNDPLTYAEMLGSKGIRTLRMAVRSFPKTSVIHPFLTFVLSKAWEVKPMLFNRSVPRITRMFVINKVWNNDIIDQRYMQLRKHYKSPMFKDKPLRAIQTILATKQPDLQDLTW